jgi:hypothetical protein
MRQAARKPQILRGGIDPIGADRRLSGWVIGVGAATGARTPPLLHIAVNNAPAMTVTAERFRPELMAPPHCHGHYGFVLPLPASLPAGLVTLRITMAGEAGEIAGSCDLSPAGPPKDLVLQDILATPGRWTAADLLAMPAVLGLPAQVKKMGPARFIDALYLFVLERFPSKAELAARVTELERAWVAPEDMLRDLLTRESEFAERVSPLLCPFDFAYPFEIV